MIELSTGETWLSTPTSPIVASTAVNARMIGTLAATRAPNAIRRITSVIGSEVTNACLKSLLIASLSLLLDARVADLLDGEVGVGGLRGGCGIQRRADAVLGLILVTGDLEAKQGGVPVGRDLPFIARRVGAVEALGVGDRGKAMLDVGDHSLERGVVRGRGAALDEHLLDLVLREGVVDGALGASRLADTALGGVLRLGPDRAADREREEHERQPSPDGLLAMLGAPAPHPSGQVLAPVCGGSHISLCLGCCG